MRFLSSGIFWGFIIILFGIVILIKTVFHINIPFFRILIGILIILFGISFIVGAVSQRKSEAMFIEIIILIREQFKKNIISYFQKPLWMSPILIFQIITESL